MSFKDFFKEDSKLSSTRLNTFLLVITAILLSTLAGYLVFTGKLITELTYLIATLLGFGLGSKVSSKMIENKYPELLQKQNDILNIQNNESNK